MAREFSKAFYKSAAWRRAREAYVDERKAVDGGLCELCQEEPGTEVHHKIFLRPENINDENITLNPENFQLLCYDCHQLTHEAARRISQQKAKQRDSKRGILFGGSYYYDDDGNIQPFRVRIVWGAPGSGKTTYVRKHILPGDIVIDLDLIGRALSMADKTDVPSNVVRIAYNIRDYLYDRIENRQLDAKQVWVVAGLPKREQRHEIAKRLNADLIFIDSTFHECYSHILHDEERKDKALQLSIIEKWFKDYEPDAPIFNESHTPGNRRGAGSKKLRKSLVGGVVFSLKS